MPWRDLSNFDEMPLWGWGAVAAFTVVVWFVPTLIAVFRNRAQLRPIAILNVPGGMSWIVWTALIVWAVSGKSPPANLMTSARKGWLWIGIAILVIAAALVWHFTTRSAA